MELNDQIKEARRAAGISEAELAKRVGVTRQSVVKWELGPKRKIDGGSGVTERNLKKVEEVLGVCLSRDGGRRIPAGATPVPGVRQEHIELAQKIAKLQRQQRVVVETLVELVLAQEREPTPGDRKRRR